MLHRFVVVTLLSGLPWLAPAATDNLQISGDKMRAHVKYLSSDELEGRGVGTRGEKLATAYLAAQLEASGVKPGGDDDTYFQRVPLVGVATQPGATLTVSGAS